VLAALTFGLDEEADARFEARVERSTVESTRESLPVELELELEPNVVSLELTYVSARTKITKRE